MRPAVQVDEDNVLLRAEHGVQLLESGSLVFGVLSVVHYPTHELQLAPGDLLVAYTVGLTEALRADGCLTGLELVLKSLPEVAGLPAPEIAVALEARLIE